LQIQHVRRFATVLALAVAVACQRATGPAAVIQRAAGGDLTVALELALTPEQQEHGLMWRNHLYAGTGMLFIFDPPERDRVFWMKNTVIPLDMLFIARDGPTDGRIVGIHADATPFSLAPISVGAPATWVLEVPGGWCAHEHVQSGDRVRFRDVPPPGA
jgi:uncharacterized membrane protein (UPF0127 family)